MVMVLAGDGRVGLSSEPTPVAETAYVISGFNPMMRQIGD